MNEAYNVGFKDGASAGYKLAIEDMKLDKKPQIMKKYEGDYATLPARHNALVEAVKWMLYIDTPENFDGGKHIAARAEVERLLSEEK